MNRTKIDWCDFTWNPVIGCWNGCSYCYARRMALRFHMVCDLADWNVPRWRQSRFEKPFPKKPSRIFVNSMSDWGGWEEEWKQKVFQAMNDHSEHVFLTLTKGVTETRTLPNWMQGVTITAGALRREADFVSVEPIQGVVKLERDYRWIIIGLQTGGRKQNPDEIKWAEELGVDCAHKAIPVFFKNSLAGCYGFRQEFEAKEKI